MPILFHFRLSIFFSIKGLLELLIAFLFVGEAFMAKNIGQKMVQYQEQI